MASSPAVLARAKNQTKSWVLHGSPPGHTQIEPAITQRESLEVVQTLLQVSFASICYLRDLLPAKAFEIRDYGAIPDGVHWSYSDFIEGENPVDRSSKERQRTLLEESRGGKGLLTRILAQHKHPSAAKLTSWLDGIFEALEKRVLAGLQLSIVLDQNEPSNVIESYNFTFRYSEIAEISDSQVQDILVSPSSGNSFTIRNARTSLQGLIRHLLKTTESLPELPDRRFLTVHIFYTKDCPSDYEPPGFFPNHDINMLVPNNDSWRMNDVNIGQLKLGFHEIGLHVAHLDVAKPEADEEGDGSMPSIPSILSCTEYRPRFQDIRLVAAVEPMANNVASHRRIMEKECSQRLKDFVRLPALQSNLILTQKLAGSEIFNMCQTKPFDEESIETESEDQITTRTLSTDELLAFSPKLQASQSTTRIVMKMPTEVKKPAAVKTSKAVRGTAAFKTRVTKERIPSIQEPGGQVSKAERYLLRKRPLKKLPETQTKRVKKEV